MSLARSDMGRPQMTDGLTPDLAVTHDELRARAAGLRRRMVEAGMDALLLTTGDNLRYVSGYPSPVRSGARPFVFIQALAMELARDNIRVNVLAPGSTDTSMLWATTPPEGLGAARKMVAEAQPVGYTCSPEQIARAALWLATKDVDFMTGATLLIDGGMLARWPGPL